MRSVVSRDDIIPPWIDDYPTSMRFDRAEALERDIRTFLQLSTALALSRTEEGVLLDLGSCDMALLRLAPANAFQLGRAKLERRVTYAIVILRRMLASAAH